MKIRRRPLLLGAAALAIPTLVATVLTISAGPAYAHGAMMMPGSRTFFCYQDGLTPQGNIVSQNPACAAATAQSGTTSLYNWFAVLRSDGAGRMSGFIPDGRLCSAAATVYDFSGYDLPRSDWPVTHLTSGANMQFRYNDWAKHPGTFRLYVTKDGFNPTQTLTWNSLESTPFLSVTDPPANGGPGTVDGYYYFNGNLPANKSGRHIIYSVWQRSDSQETFYGCSDVVFDGGNGEVTGIGNNGGGSTTSPGGGTTTPPVPSAGCMATFAVASSWSGGFQGTVTVMNHDATPIHGWKVSWTVPSGQTINSVWNGTLALNGTTATVGNASWNGTINQDGTTTFGFLANGSPGVPALTCTAS